MHLTRRTLLSGASALALTAALPATSAATPAVAAVVPDPLARICAALEESLVRYLDHNPNYPFEGAWSPLYAKWLSVLDLRRGLEQELAELYSKPEVVASITAFGLLDVDGRLPLFVQYEIVDRLPIEPMLLTRAVLDDIAACAPAHLK